MTNLNFIGDLDLRITNKCNTKCRHCMFSCGPERTEELPFYQVKKAIEIYVEGFNEDLSGKLCSPYLSLMDGHEIMLSTKKKTIKLSGGEVFEYSRFDKFFEYLREVEIPFWMLTNGFAIFEGDNFSDKFRKIVDSGLHSLAVCNGDGYLAKLEKEKIDKIREFCKDREIIFTYIYHDAGAVNDIGRGISYNGARQSDSKQPPQTEKRSESACALSQCYLLSNNKETLNIFLKVNPYGNIVHCYSETITLGNISENLNVVADRIVDNPVLRLLMNKNGPRKLAKVAYIVAEKAGLKSYSEFGAGRCWHIMHDKELSEEIIKFLREKETELGIRPFQTIDEVLTDSV